jgi:ubiquinone/menaquinone biosynthesis C-methylase UbiE
MISYQTDGVLLTGRKANYYDFENYFYGVHHVNRRHLSFITIESGQILLDVGCGSANTIYELNRQLGERVKLYGIDPSADMISVANQKLAKNKGVHLAVGLGESLDFYDGLFDWVTSCLTPHHLPNTSRRQMFQECFRVMKPNGRLLISDFGSPTNALGRFGSVLWKQHAFVSQILNDEIPKMIKEAGFQISSRQVQLGVIHHIQAHKPDVPA